MAPDREPSRAPGHLPQTGDREVVRREEGPVRTFVSRSRACQLRRLPLLSSTGVCAGEELVHGGSRVPIVHQVTADE